MMKQAFAIFWLFIAVQTSFGQQIGKDSDKSKLLPPLRGKKDMRPKQFANVDRSRFASVDLMPTIQALPATNVDEETKFMVAGLNPIKARMISKKNSFAGTAFAFRVTNDEYKGAMLFINILKRKDNTIDYVGHMLRPGYSDVLKLRHLNGRLYFEVETAQNVVLD